MSATSITRRNDVADILTLGFGTTVALWAIGYVCRLPGSPVPPPAKFVLFIACLVAGGLLAGRLSPRGWRAGLAAGFITGLLNLLILGSLLVNPESNQIMPAAALWAPGSVLATSALMGFMAWVGQRLRRSDAAPLNWRCGFCLVAVGATLLLLSVGGVVTGFQAGLAVPDWPNSYGYNMFLYPLARMTGGVYFEHTHRLIGSLVGITTLVLSIYLQFGEPRRWVRVIAGLSLVMVIVQGLLGGLRVTGNLTLSTSGPELSPQIALAIVHGVFGQVFFATLIGLAVVQTRAWRDAPAPVMTPAAGGDRTIGLLAVAALVVQILLGALLRHVAWGLALHIAMAVFVLVLVGLFGVRMWGAYPHLRPLHNLGLATLATACVQIMAGFGALLGVQLDAGQTGASAIQVTVTTLHQSIGAILLGLTFALLLWHHRLLAPAPDAEAVPSSA